MLYQTSSQEKYEVIYGDTITLRLYVLEIN